LGEIVVLMDQVFENQKESIAKVLGCLIGKEFVKEGSKVLFIQSKEYGEDGSPLLKDFMLNYSKNEYFVYRNDIKELEEKPSAPIMKWLMRRYYLIEKARDAEVIGIIAGTLVVDRYMEMIERVKYLISKANKVSFLFLIVL
jgi:diphthamide biosynthesis protein 2